MALGVQRNRADAMAYACRVAGRSYAVDYRYRKTWLEVSKAARQMGAAMLNMVKPFYGAAAAWQKLRDSLAVHHARPITPENLEGGEMVIVTRQEHERLHGYSAKVSFVDELDGAGGGRHE
jgi:hypothetical protein